MQWSRASNAGFCPPGVAPWLPVHPNYQEGVNVADQLEEPDSLLAFYRRLIRLRQRTPALLAGEYVPLAEDSEEALVFLRRLREDGSACLVAMNMSEGPAHVRLDLPTWGRCLFSTHRKEGAEEALRELRLVPFEITLMEILRR
jgi:alpha-glucosidase